MTTKKKETLLGDDEREAQIQVRHGDTVSSGNASYSSGAAAYAVLKTPPKGALGVCFPEEGNWYHAHCQVDPPGTDAMEIAEKLVTDWDNTNPALTMTELVAEAIEQAALAARERALEEAAQQCTTDAVGEKIRIRIIALWQRKPG